MVREVSLIEMLDAFERGRLFRIHPERVKFLLACPHAVDWKPGTKKADKQIPYDGGIAQLREAARMQISAKDVAKMMDWPIEKVVATALDHGITFVPKTLLKQLSTKDTFTFFWPDNQTQK
ncbi:hypothetical protein UFOVP201_7 [uncultured Caudovirales phage]|uniref:Uncharacterized protein n=1 Tax=uncultured Caudovirales phage TaxID=2100421 RepID=A0A6J7WQL3_9CAUD|nr:hypothetical protein UFOVP201_7 [uncultured Caudovirales phage]